MQYTSQLMFSESLFTSVIREFVSKFLNTVSDSMAFQRLYLTQFLDDKLTVGHCKHRVLDSKICTDQNTPLRKTAVLHTPGHHFVILTCSVLM